MSSESEDQCSKAQSKSAEDTLDFHKEPKISYSRNFLFSLSELDMCKTLPSGFDGSMIWDHGDYLTQLFRSPGYSDSSRLRGNLSRHSFRIPKHGLLGSSPIPSITGNISGASPSMAQGGNNCLLNKSNAPYRPPHLCKANVYSGGESRDFYNNKMLDSSEQGSQKKGEEVRTKESFELMRNAQQNDVQENQSNIRADHKGELDPYATTTLEGSGKGTGLENKYNVQEQCTASLSPFSDYSGHYSTSSATGNLLSSTPTSKSYKKDVGMKVSTHTLISEPCDANKKPDEGSLSHSSVFAHEFLGEDTMVSSILSGDKKGCSKIHTTERNNTYISSRRNEFPFKGMMSASTSATDETSVKARSYCDGVFLPSPDNHEHDASQDFLSFIQKWLKQTDVMVDEPLERTHETMMLSSSIKQNGPGNIEGGPSVSIVTDLQSQPDSTPRLAGAFDDCADLLDNICLPEEDSLITVDDWIFPENSTLASGNSVESILSTSTLQFDTSHKLPAPDLTLFDQRLTLCGSEGHIIDAYDVMGFGSSYHDGITQQANPQYHQHQRNLRSGFFKSSDTQKVRTKTKTGSLDVNIHHCHPQLCNCLPTNAFTDPLQQPLAELTRFGHPIIDLQPQQMPVLRNFPSVHHLHKLPRRVPSQHVVSEITSYAPHPAQDSLFVEQSYYRGFQMPMPGNKWPTDLKF